MCHRLREKKFVIVIEILFFLFVLFCFLFFVFLFFVFLFFLFLFFFVNVIYLYHSCILVIF